MRERHMQKGIPLPDRTVHRGYQEPTKTDLDQVIRVADATRTPAYSWSDRFGKFIHLAGPEIPELDRARKTGPLRLTSIFHG